MYRRLSTSLPKDPVFPDGLESLGYCVDARDRIVKIEYPDEYFQFFITNNERYNNVQREAMHGWVRNEVIRRMTGLGSSVLYLPQISIERPDMPHISILTTPIRELRTKKRVIIVANDTIQDLGIYSYRDLTREAGIARGSVISTFKSASARSTSVSEAPGMIVLNPGQLYYSHRYNRCMTWTSWDALPRKSAVHPAPRVDPIHNRVLGHETPAAHLQSVFETVVANANIVDPNAQIFIIACGSGCEQVLQYLHSKWPTWSQRITAIALAERFFSVVPNPKPNDQSSPASALSTNKTQPQPTPAFSAFLAARVRGWAVSHHALNTPLANPHIDTAPICTASSSTTSAADTAADAEFDFETARTWYPHLASGESEYVESIMTSEGATEAVLAWFDEVAAGGAGYRNPVFEVVQEDGEEDGKVEMEAEEGAW